MAVKPILDSQKLKLANDLNALHISGNSLAFTGEGKSMGLARSLFAAPCLMLAACGAASGSTNETTNAPVTSNAVSATPIPTTTDPKAFKLGVNVGTISLWDNSRPLMNLIYAVPAQMQNTNPSGGSEDIPGQYFDANGWVKSLPTGYQVRRGLSVPAAGGDFICRYQGNGLLRVESGPVSNVSSSAGALKFTIAPTNPADWKAVTITYFVDPSNYIRDIDCREAGASTTAITAPEFLSVVNGFKVLRFVKWSKAEENPASITWATRNKPGDGDFSRNDGVPVEYIVDAANQANADPWVNIPWNADNDYITRYATYVRDNMASGHQVYVEVSNEVWNWGYPVTTQAKNEAIAEGLLSAEGTGAPGGNGERYSERVRQVMAIWSNVFSGQMNRLVRVFAFQHVQPYWSDRLLAYQDTYKYVDALATAPYFGHEAETWTTGQSLDSIMNTLLPAKAAEAVTFGVQQKAVAQKYNLRYVTYEAGQHVTLPNNLPLLMQIERDPRMYDIYKTFISAWQSQIGDTMNLFALTGNISRYGAWGISEYANQPLSEAPKRRAVQEFLGIATASVDTGGTTTTTTTTDPVVTASTQICPDGSIILLTSTCPTTTSTPTTSPTKKGNKGKGGGGGRTVTALA